MVHRCPTYTFLIHNFSKSFQTGFTFSMSGLLTQIKIAHEYFIFQSPQYVRIIFIHNYPCSCPIPFFLQILNYLFLNFFLTFLFPIYFYFILIQFETLHFYHSLYFSYRQAKSNNTAAVCIMPPITYNSAVGAVQYVPHNLIINNFLYPF